MDRDDVGGEPRAEPTGGKLTPMSPDLAHLRDSYDRSMLRRSDLAAHPIEQFGRWFGEWTATPRNDAAACVLATADADGRPSARYVLCRRFDEHGFDLYTNLDSRKGRELDANPRAALLFGWLDLQRQIRVEGPVDVVPDDEADAYWATRPRGSRLGAWASEQSEVLVDRAELDQHVTDAARRFTGSAGEDLEVPRPPFWGGFRVGIDEMEFWQGRPDRLHDRFRYRRDPDADPDTAGWVIDRLSP